MARPFTATFPKDIEDGDSVKLKGKLRDDAKIFSINFVVDCRPMPSYIPYHFKTRFDVPENEAVSHNHKFGDWGEEETEGLTWVSGPGEEFNLEFIIRDENIYVYTDAGAQYNFQFRSPWREIKAIQIWDDLEYIESIEFKYKIPRQY